MNFIMKFLKATISNLIVALIYTLIIIFILYIVLGNNISEAIALINTMSVEKSENNVEKIKFDIDNMRLINYPEYGTQYGRLIIESINVDLPLYFGDTLSILKNGIGHSSGSYFPR